MYCRSNVDLLKDVDIFIEQAKLEGEISGSSSSNASMDVLKTAEESKNEKVDDGNVRNNQAHQSLIEDAMFDDKLLEEKDASNCLIHHENNKNKLNSTRDLDDENFNNSKFSKSKLKKEEKLIGEKARKHKDKASDDKKGKTIEDLSRDSSYVDLGNDQGRNKTPYVMWLQERRSRQALNKDEKEESLSDKKEFQREDVHLHEINSALFWERWMDKVFDMYDHWVQSSDSEDSSVNIKQTIIGRESKNMAQPTRIKSEPIMKFQSNEINQSSRLRYKSPSYVDWLVERRQERLESSDSEEVVEKKNSDNYWTSLYGKLAKSISSIFVAPRGSIKAKRPLEDQEEGADSKPLSKSPSGSPRITSTGLRRSHSHSCSHYRHSYTSDKLRYRQLSQESVGSPVLTDQLVELVCNTLSPDSSDDSSDDYRRRKVGRKTTKHRSLTRK